MANPLIFISSIFPMFSFPNMDNAPTNEESKIGLISESKIKSSRYSPVSLHMMIPFRNCDISVYFSDVIVISPDF